MDDLTLKVCPFCGGNASVMNSSKGEWVECDDCGAESCWANWNNNGEFMENWNKRVHFSTIKGKQLIDEKAIAYLHDNHQEIYKEFCKLA